MKRRGKDDEEKGENEEEVNGERAGERITRSELYCFEHGCKFFFLERKGHTNP